MLFTLSHHSTALDLKKQIATRIGQKANCLSLVLAGKQLRDNQEVVDGSSLSLIVLDAEAVQEKEERIETLRNMFEPSTREGRRFQQMEIESLYQNLYNKPTPLRNHIRPAVWQSGLAKRGAAETERLRGTCRLCFKRWCPIPK